MLCTFCIASTIYRFRSHLSKTRAETRKTFFNLWIQMNSSCLVKDKITVKLPNRLHVAWGCVLLSFHMTAVSYYLKECGVPGNAKRFILLRSTAGDIRCCFFQHLLTNFICCSTIVIFLPGSFLYQHKVHLVIGWI